ncbi:unnamed protein product [Rotaria sp. Silwood1]|nr:unnamed protein product [Rotaria sp. Silwood1]
MLYSLWYFWHRIALWPFARQYCCDCSSSGAVTTTDDGFDRHRNCCRVSIARPNSCWPFARQYSCDCSSSGAVTTTDDGFDRHRNRCRVSIARPNSWFTRGKNIHPKKKQRCSYRCDCSSSGAVTTTDDGFDRHRNGCRVSIARPNSWFACGKNIHPKKKQRCSVILFDSIFDDLV